MPTSLPYNCAAKGNFAATRGFKQKQNNKQIKSGGAS